VTDHEAAAYQRFLGAARRYWAGPMFQALQRQIATDAPADAFAFAAFVEAHPTHRMFAWFERHLQRMKYSGRWGLAPVHAERRDDLLRDLAAPMPDGLLALDPAAPQPAYWREHDIHQHPGGLGGDDLAGLVYRAAAGQGGVVGRPQLHERFAAAAVAASPSPRRIADLGCGFGRSTLAFAAAVPEAEVTGIDLSAGCLRLAAAETPPALHNRVRFRQADACATGLPEGGFDLVTSTMLLHELPADALRALVGETARLLAPGGVAVHLDFLPPEDPFLRVIYDGHSRRNNEPFMQDLAAFDLNGEHARAGFADLAIERFAEADGALDGPPRSWRLPWTMIVARLPPTPSCSQETTL
jgi:ubiquinone/menaquinone biosynthesis C-methylase UbiE